MIDPLIFYSKFQVNYFDYKQAYLIYALNNFRELRQEDRIMDYSEKDFEIAIKSDIRQTLFQAIETLFELVFALTPDKKGNIYDKDILRTLSKAEFPYERITKIAGDINKLNFFETQITLSNNKTVELGEYIFYFGLYSLEKVQEKKQESLQAIKTALHLLANEFSDRKEYNCYKHGLRIIPALEEFQIWKSETKEKLISWDLSDSMTYYLEDYKSTKHEFVTKVFDTERDIKLTVLCSELLWNIIKIRDIAFNKSMGNSIESFNILFFNKDLIKTSYKMNVLIQDLKFKTYFNNES